MSQKTILTYRSSMVTLLNCRRAGYWSRYYQGSSGSTASLPGLQQVKRPLYQVVGSAVHHTLQQLMLSESTGSLVEQIQHSLQESWAGQNATAEADHPSLEFAIREQKDMAHALC